MEGGGVEEQRVGGVGGAEFEDEVVVADGLDEVDVAVDPGVGAGEAG
ncbi:Uncharacterised protein [Rhodococcus wratislaviensis]|uniref:Uncharacterized protein n=1 Tax=Rhodococcus wratislaviensis TaxID=44752 RepID=A0AB38F7W1_RHOWR|nr:Uncharacterised protein [Rhodococcus wratislaviensis]